MSAMPSRVTTARPSRAKYGGMLNGMSLSTVRRSWVIAWNPPAVDASVPSSMLYMRFSSASYFFAPPPFTYGDRALSISGMTFARSQSGGRIFRSTKSSTSCG